MCKKFIYSGKSLVSFWNMFASWAYEIAEILTERSTEEASLV